jgi:hypothetical protein
VSILNYKNSRVDKLFDNVLQTFKPDIIVSAPVIFIDELSKYRQKKKDSVHPYIT